MKNIGILRTHHLPHLLRRLAALGATAALALGMILPLTANAAPAVPSQATACNGNLQCLISFGDTQIGNRLTALNTLSSNVNERLSDQSITSDQANALQSDVTTNESGLNNLKAKIDADTDPKVALTDDRNIFLQFRIYAAVLLHDYHLLWFDIMQKVDSQMRGYIPVIQDAINGAPSNIQGQLNTLFTDYKNQLSSAEAQFDAINTDLPQITPENFNNNNAAFETALTNLRSEEKTAHNDLHAAANDLHQMYQLIKAG